MATLNAKRMLHSTHTQPLIKFQNKIIRIITNSHFLASSEKLYKERGILPFCYVSEISNLIIKV